MTATARPMRCDVLVTDLATWARTGDEQAWDALVERYAPLVWSICRRHRLGRADAEDVGQSVWLRLVDQLDNLRDPAGLAGWPPPPGGNAAGSFVQSSGRAPGQVRDTENIPDEQSGVVEHELLRAERNAALREGFLDLPPGCQRLFTLLIEAPRQSYAQISATLGIPIGSIGPSRGRCLDKLRHHPAIAALINPEAHAEMSGMGRRWCGNAISQ